VRLCVLKYLTNISELKFEVPKVPKILASSEVERIDITLAQFRHFSSL